MEYALLIIGIVNLSAAIYLILELEKFSPHFMRYELEMFREEFKLHYDWLTRLQELQDHKEPS